MQPVIAVEMLVPVLILVALGAVHGYRQGPRTAVALLIALTLAALAFCSVQGRVAVGRIAASALDAVAGTTGSPLRWLDSIEAVALLGLGLFVLTGCSAVILAGKLAEPAGSAEQRGMAVVLGGLSGFVVALGLHTLAGAGNAGRPNVIRFALPVIEIPDPGAQFVAVQAAPAVFLVGLSIVAILAALGNRRAR